MIPIWQKYMSIVGGFGVVIAAALVLMGLRANLPAPIGGFSWQILTGIFLAGCFVHQWVVVIRKWTGNRAPGNQSKFWHIVVGLGMLVLFAAHAPRLGHASTYLLSLVFLGNAVLGLSHSLVLRAKSQKLFLTWTFLHYGISMVMVPLVLLHIWAAIAFK